MLGYHSPHRREQELVNKLLDAISPEERYKIEKEVKEEEQKFERSRKTLKKVGWHGQGSMSDLVRVLG